MARKMSEGECARTRKGVLYCYLPAIGVRFCARGARDAKTCGAYITGDKRRGRWRRERID